MTKDVNVFLMDFPNTKEKEMITENTDGTYSVFINSRMAYNQQLSAYQHALEHIKKNDFQNDDVQRIEAVAHAEKIKISKAPVIEKRLKKRRRRRSSWARVERIRREKEALGITPWDEYEAHWLDPEYRF